MKLIVRAFVLTIFVAGASAAVVTSHASSMMPATPNHQVSISRLPVPVCTPGVPGCPHPGGGK